MSTRFSDYHWGPRAQMFLNLLEGRPQPGIPSTWLNVMDTGFLDEFTGNPNGAYLQDNQRIYLQFQHSSGACFVDQWIPNNPASMRDHGYQADTHRSATTGAEQIVLDGIAIDSPEAVAQHLEQIVFPGLIARTRQLAASDLSARESILKFELGVQAQFGPEMLKVPYVFALPALHYGPYGYENYFLAYALFPDVIARHFALQAEYATLFNQAVARAIQDNGLPKLIRLDHDMADSRGTLVDVKSLDKIWFPQFSKCTKPLLDAGIRLIWHCDGNLMQMVPRLIACGLSGFQGFQYEDGMDYVKICRMKDRQGQPLFIWAGASVTRTLPFGTVDEVKKELAFLVENGPRGSLCLGASSSIAPNTKRENIRALIEGLRYYRVGKV